MKNQKEHMWKISVLWNGEHHSTPVTRKLHFSDGDINHSVHQPHICNTAQRGHLHSNPHPPM